MENKDEKYTALKKLLELAGTVGVYLDDNGQLCSCGEKIADVEENESQIIIDFSGYI